MQMIKVQNPRYSPQNVKEFLLKYWWMGYHQLPEYNDFVHKRSGQYLNWQWFINDLTSLSAIIDRSSDQQLDAMFDDLQRETFDFVHQQQEIHENRTLSNTDVNDQELSLNEIKALITELNNK